MVVVVVVVGRSGGREGHRVDKTTTASATGSHVSRTDDALFSLRICINVGSREEDVRVQTLVINPGDRRAH